MNQNVERGAETRQRILDKAIALLGRRGESGLTASALARAAGVSKANLFHHFASIEDIALAAFDRLMSTESSDDTFARGKPAGLGEVLGEIAARATAVVQREHRFLSAYLALFQRALVEPRHRRKARASALAAERKLTAALATALGSEVASAEIAALAHLVLSAHDGLGLHALLTRDAEAHRRALELLGELITARYARKRRRG